MDKYGHYYICKFTYMLTACSSYSNHILNYSEYMYNAVNVMKRVSCTLKEFVDYEFNPLT